MEQLMKELIERIEALERRCFNLAWVRHGGYVIRR